MSGPKVVTTELAAFVELVSNDAIEREQLRERLRALRKKHRQAVEAHKTELEHVRTSLLEASAQLHSSERQVQTLKSDLQVAQTIRPAQDTAAYLAWSLYSALEGQEPRHQKFSDGERGGTWQHPEGWEMKDGTQTTSTLLVLLDKLAPFGIR